MREAINGATMASMSDATHYSEDSRRPPRFELWPVLATGALPFVLALLPALLGIYGRFNDELYFIACSKHLALGYVDQPPLSIWLLAAVRFLLGDSLVALRIVPASCAFATALLTGFLAHRFGAQRWGQVVSALCTGLIIPLNVVFSFYSMNPLSVILWIAAAAALVELDYSENPRYWLVFGAIAGLAALNKHPALVFIALLAVCYALFHLRALFGTKELYLGALLAVAIAAPNLIWQARHDWISLWFYKQSALKNIPTPPLSVLGFQVATINPGSLLLLVGVVFFFRAERWRRFGWIAVACGSLFLFFVFSGQSRPDRIMAIYPILFAAAAAGWETRRAPHWGRVLRIAVPITALATFVVIAPAMLPLLPPRIVAAHAARIGIVPKIENVGRSTALPQWLADRLGWEELARRVALVVQGQPQGSKIALVGSDYGFAGSLAFYGPALGLPRVYGYHNAFYDWGPPPSDTEIFILVGVSIERAQRYFGEARLVASGDCRLCLAERRHPPIIVARHPRRSLAEIWRLVRLYI